MIELAEQYAKLKGTKVIAHKIYDDHIVFILESGQKIKMTKTQIQNEIKSLSPAQAGETIKPKKKGSK